MDTCRARIWRLQVLAEPVAVADALLQACVRHDGVRYFGRAGACVWLAFANPVSKASVLAIFQDHPIAIIGTGGVVQEDLLEEEWGVRPRSLLSESKKEADKEKPLQDTSPRHAPAMEVCPRKPAKSRQALLKALKKAAPGEPWVDQVDMDAARLQEDVRTLVDNVYDTMLKMTSALPKDASSASAQADALRESQKIQGELEFMKARHILQEACITKQRKQINILRSGLIDIRDKCKENVDCGNILQTLLEHATSASAGITNKEAIQELPKCIHEQEVCHQVLGCITSLHTEIKRLKGKTIPDSKKQKKA